MEKRFLKPEGLAISPSYTHTLEVRGGSLTLFISGQVPIDEKGEIVGKGDIRAQTRQTFENLRRALGAAGASFENVVKITTYIVGYKPEMLAPIRDVRAEFLPKENPPASTLVGVEALFIPGVMIEVEAIAML